MPFNDLIKFNITYELQYTVYTDSTYTIYSVVCVSLQRMCLLRQSPGQESAAIQYTYTYIVLWFGCLACTRLTAIHVLHPVTYYYIQLYM